LRISSLPTQFGEKVVLRLLPSDQIPLDLESLGLTASDFTIVLRNVLRPHGMILITGPTGSGKSTSLYAMIMRVATERHNLVNISTVEDPIEYTMPRVNQIQFNAKAGLDFASGLRALLRQDPDVIMIGEIRDRETADIAVRSAMVGRLLLSTLHTNDATSAVPRLLDIGVEPYLLASTLNVVVGQLLVRKICMNCRESIPPSNIDLKAITCRPDFESTIRILRREGILSNHGDPLSSMRFFRGRGCKQCHGQGTYGRIGIFELFEIDDDIRPMIIAKESGAAIRAAAMAKGMKTLFQDGLAKALLGETTLSEVFRVAN
jgi:general secretion pathway protein E